MSNTLLSLLAAKTTTVAATTAYSVTGGVYTVAAYGTFDSNSVDLEISFDGTNFVKIAGYTTAQAANLTLPRCKVRGKVTGGTTFSLNLVLAQG